jgi:transketolase
MAQMLTAPTTDRTPTAYDGPFDEVDRLAVDTLRFLAADMVQAANSGHPGLPMGAAPMAWTLWSRHLRHDPSHPDWADRDRFVLSAGHGSALLYALLHVTGYDLPESELRAFRRLGSATPGHPEVGHTVGVETTTGPLGQGLAMAVGLALAERMTAARHPEVTDHHTWALVGDGCLMEGVSHEAASLAAHLGLGRLVVLWDDNEITIDGATGLATSEDQVARFAAYGWHTVRVEDGTDLAAIDAALTEATADRRPSFVAVRTVIGHGAPGVEGTSKAHGSPLGEAVLAEAKRRAGWEHADFAVPDEVRERACEVAARGAEQHAAWRASYADYATQDPRKAAELERTWAGELPAALGEALFPSPEEGSAATSRQRREEGSSEPRSRRSLPPPQSSHDVPVPARSVLPELVGGSADLAGSTGVDVPGTLVTQDDASGDLIAFGIREFAMAAVLNGMSLHGGWRVFGSTFLVFSDYLRPALRLSALMGQPVIHVLTHDSVAVGEDGPTHQPVEHVESLRLIPGLQVLRPADEAETAQAWRLALERTDGPTALILSRQTVPALPTGHAPDRAYAVRDAADPEVEIVATGSEVALALTAAGTLAAEGVKARVVSAMDRSAYRPDRSLPRVSIEAGVTSGWGGLVDLAIGVDDFGASGPGDQVLAHVGLTPEAVTARIRELLAAHPRGRD